MLTRSRHLQVRGYSPIDPDIVPSPQLLAANQALKLQELTTRKQELLSELQGYQVQRIPGTCMQDLPCMPPWELQHIFQDFSAVPAV